MLSQLKAFTAHRNKNKERIRREQQGRNWDGEGVDRGHKGDIVSSSSSATDSLSSFKSQSAFSGLLGLAGTGLNLCSEDLINVPLPGGDLIDCTFPSRASAALAGAESHK